jgi:AcrR family transcriptional regulator
MPTPRQRAHEQTLDDILRLGREQLASVGAASLSLRSVARDLGVVSSAVYRYVRSRDDLLTLLVVDAYDELGDRVDAAIVRRRAGDHAGRLRAAGHAVRDWGLAEPARYALIFGSPVPDYRAPAERTTEPGTRVVVALARLVADAWLDGTVTDGGQATKVPRKLSADFARIRDEIGVDLPDGVLARAMLAWTALFGSVSFEVFGQYGPDTLTEPRQLFAHHLDRLVELTGLAS